MRVAVIAIVVVGVLVLLGGGGAGYYLAGQAQTNTAIDAVNKDIDKLNSSYSLLDQLAAEQPSFPDFTSASTPQDFISSAKQFDGSADQVLSQFSQVKTILKDDQGTLADATSHIDSAARSWLTLAQRSRLSAGRRRLGYEQQALTLAAQVIDVVTKQVQSARSAIDGLSGYADMVIKLQAGDYAGSLKEYGSVHTMLAQAGTYSQGAHLPAVWDTLLADVNKLADDTRGGLQAIQAGDSAAALAKANAIDADSKTLDGLDTSNLNSSTAYTDGLVSQIKALEAKAG